MEPLSVVLDTNVLVSALRSRRGASFQILDSLARGKFQPNVSVSLVLEYEAAAKKRSLLPAKAVEDVIDYICAVAVHRKIYFLWRPVLRDPKDDMVLELAVAAGGAAIITHNRGDFYEARRFGVRVLSPREFLNTLKGERHEHHQP